MTLNTLIMQANDTRAKNISEIINASVEYMPANITTVYTLLEAKDLIREDAVKDRVDKFDIVVAGVGDDGIDLVSFIVDVGSPAACILVSFDENDKVSTNNKISLSGMVSIVIHNIMNNGLKGVQWL